MKTITQIIQDFNKCDHLFEGAKRDWERGNNSGNSEILEKCYKTSEKKHEKAEAILKPYHIECDYPGLYPSFMFDGHCYYSLDSIRIHNEKALIWGMGSSTGMLEKGIERS